MFGSPYSVFVFIFAVVLSFEYDFLTKDHLHCEVNEEDRAYTELFCMARTRNLRTNAEGAHLRNYGRWQFFIIIQMFVTAISCRIDLKIRELKNQSIGKRYVLTICILLNIIVCWMFTLWSMGGYFNTYISRVLSHAVDRKSVVSPLEDVFPMRADCFVQFTNSSETFTTNCELPLNATAPYYYIALFVIYLLGLQWTLERILNLAKEKIAESRKASNSAGLPENREIFTTTAAMQDWMNQEQKPKNTILEVPSKLTVTIKNALKHFHHPGKYSKLEPLV